MTADNIYFDSTGALTIETDGDDAIRLPDAAATTSFLALVADAARAQWSVEVLPVRAPTFDELHAANLAALRSFGGGW